MPEVNAKEIEEKVIRTLARVFGMKKKKISLDKQLDVLGADSLKMVEIVLNIEEWLYDDYRVIVGSRAKVISIESTVNDLVKRVIKTISAYKVKLLKKAKRLGKLKLGLA